MEKLYKHPWLSSSIFVLFVERNVTAGPYVLEAIMDQRYTRRYIITDPIRNKIGWWTDRHMKTEYVVAGAKQMREGKIYFLDNIVCENPWINRDIRKTQVRGKLLEQIPKFRLKEAPEGSKKKMPILSGKFDERGKQVPGANDDTALAFFMCLYFLEGITQETIPSFDYKYIKQQQT